VAGQYSRIEADGATTQIGSASEAIPSAEPPWRARATSWCPVPEGTDYWLNMARALVYRFMARGEIPSFLLCQRTATNDGNCRSSSKKF